MDFLICLGITFGFTFNTLMLTFYSVCTEQFGSVCKNRRAEEKEDTYFSLYFNWFRVQFNVCPFWITNSGTFGSIVLLVIALI